MNNILNKLAILITGTKEYKMQQKILAINIIVWNIYLIHGLIDIMP